jgi:crossover junction endodeoxyribonuclease RusA
MPYLYFEIEGTPAPQGSLRHIGGGRMISANPRTIEWRQTIADTIQPQLPADWQPINEATLIQIIFILPKPKTSKNKRPIVKPDIDKQIRSVLDAVSLTRHMPTPLLKDDSIVTDIHAAKRYTTDTWTGIRLFVEW